MSRSDKKGNQSPQVTERARTPAGDSAKQKIPEAEASGNLLEVTTRFELVDEGFADPCLTTWPRHHIGSDEYHSNGAADEARTRYLHLGKVALYQMSYGRILHVASRGIAPGDVDYYTASRGRCQHPICIFCNFWSKRPTFGPASCNLQLQTSLHHVIGRPMTIQFRSGSAPLMRRKLICIPHRELL